MKKLSQHSSKIFTELLHKLGNRQHIRLTVDDYMPLTLELVAINIATPYGSARLYSLMHHFILNGDLMRDPEMTFLVIDARENPKDHNGLSVFPQSYQLDPLSIYEESVTISNQQTIGYLFTYQSAHCSFANLWLSNIKAQGFLK